MAPKRIPRTVAAVDAQTVMSQFADNVLELRIIGDPIRLHEYFGVFFQGRSEDAAAHASQQLDELLAEIMKNVEAMRFFRTNRNINWADVPEILFNMLSHLKKQLSPARKGKAKASNDAQRLRADRAFLRRLVRLTRVDVDGAH